MEELASINIANLDESQAAIYKALVTPTVPSAAEAISSQVAELMSKLEPSIDLLADGVHKISQYRLAAENVADKILLGAAKGLA